MSDKSGKKKKKGTKAKQPKENDYSKRDLMKLSMKDLKKICKKNKYAVEEKATKIQIINTILSFARITKIANNEQLSSLQKGEYLTSGYVRNNINSISKQKYDHQISILVSQYIGMGLFMCFDIYHPKYAQNVKSNGKIVERGVYKFIRRYWGISRFKNGKIESQGEREAELNVLILFGSSIGMKQGIHEWRIKLIKYCTNLDSNKRMIDLFGVTKNINLCFKENCFDDDMKHDLFAYDFTDGWRQSYNSPTPYIKDKDVIKFILDCNSWKLQFEVNGKLDSKVINLEPNCEYFPAILSYRNKTKYKLMKNF